MIPKQTNNQERLPIGADYERNLRGSILQVRLDNDDFKKNLWVHFYSYVAQSKITDLFKLYKEDKYMEQ